MQYCGKVILTVCAMRLNYSNYWTRYYKMFDMEHCTVFLLLAHCSRILQKDLMSKSLMKT